MYKAFATIGRWAAYALAALMLVYAGAVSALRLKPELLDPLKQTIEVEASSVLQRQVSVEGIHVDTTYLFPMLALTDVRIEGESSSAQTVVLNQALVDVAWWKTMFEQQWAVEEVYLHGLQLFVRRDTQGNVSLNRNFEWQVDAQDDMSAPSLPESIRLQLTDIDLHIVDEVRAFNYSFEKIRMGIYLDGDKYSLAGSMQLPEKLGEFIEFSADIDGNLPQLKINDADFFVDGRNMVINEWLAMSKMKKESSLGGVYTGKLWGSLRAGRLTQLKGDVDLSSMQKPPADEAQLICADDNFVRGVRGKFAIGFSERGWSLRVNDAQVSTEDEVWPAGGGFFRFEKISENQRAIRGRVDWIDLNPVCRSLSGVPSVKRSLTALNEELRFSGTLSQVNFVADIEEDRVSSWTYSGAVHDGALDFVKSGRRIGGLEGRLSASDQGGQITLDDSFLHLTLPTFFAGQPLDIHMNGQVFWLRENSGYQVWTEGLRGKNADVDLKTRLFVSIDQGRPYVDAKVNILSGKAKAIGKYFPTVKLVSRTKSWLTDGIQQGDIVAADVVIRGALYDFPFSRAPGVFTVDGDVENATVEYIAGWPKISNIAANVWIDKETLRVTGKHVDILNSHSDSVVVGIDDFSLPILTVEANVTGPANDWLEYISHLDVKNGQSDNRLSMLEDLSFEGEGRLSIQVVESLTSNVEQPTHVEGDAEFIKNKIKLASIGLNLEDVDGAFHFSPAGGSSERISANYLGEPVAITTRAANQGETEFSFSGQIDTSSVLANYQIDESLPVTGATSVQGRFLLPSLFSSQVGSEMLVELQTELAGVQIDLPYPVGKSSEEYVATNFLYFPENDLITLTYGDYWQARLKQNGSADWAIANLHLGLVDQTLESHVGMSVTGKLDHISIDDWLALENEETDEKWLDDVSHVDLQVDSIHWLGQDISALTIQANRKEDYLYVTLDSSITKGQIGIPSSTIVDEPLVFDLEHLNLRSFSSERESLEGKSSGNELTFSPRDIPPVEFSAKHLDLEGYHLSPVSFSSLPVDNGVDIRNIHIGAEDMQLLGDGSWLDGQVDGAHRSSFSMEFSSTDIEDTLDDLGFDSALRKGEAEAFLNLSWDSKPWDITLENLSGDAQLEMRDGTVTEVKNNAGRLLALFNLGAIGRRLSLDFSDIYRDGYTFEKIKGDLRLKSGELATDNLRIKSPSADIEIQGKTNLPKQTYDQQVTVTPKVTGGLPVAGALLGGPVVGAAIFLADKLTKSIGQDLDRVTRSRYKLSGTWEDPIFEKIPPKEQDKESKNLASRP